MVEPSEPGVVYSLSSLSVPDQYRSLPLVAYWSSSRRSPTLPKSQPKKPSIINWNVITQRKYYEANRGPLNPRDDDEWESSSIE